MKVIAFLKRTWPLYLLLLPLPVIYLYHVPGMDARSAMLPRAVSYLIILLIAALAIIEWKPALREHDSTVRVRAFLAKWWKTIGIIFLLAALVYAMGLFGFYPAVAVFLLISFTLLRVERWIRRIVLTAGVLVGCYVLFDVLLNVRLP